MYSKLAEYKKKRIEITAMIFNHLSSTQRVNVLDEGFIDRNCSSIGLQNIKADGYEIYQVLDDFMITYIVYTRVYTD